MGLISRVSSRTYSFLENEKKIFQKKMAKPQSQKPFSMEEYSSSLPHVAMENLKFYDQLFLNVLQKEQKIELFLDSVFSFLYRKTDFFRFCSKDNPKMGFPPGHANKLVEG